jgi:RNA polymerase sigma factor (sigma-70 family)
MTERIERATATDDRRAAFEALADGELDGAYRLAGIILGDRWQAEDATHDAVVQAWLRFGSLRDRDRFGAWFQRIVVNICRDRMRERVRRPITVGGDVDRSVADGSPLVDERLALDRAFAELSPDHRLTLVLRFYADLPVEQIAAVLGIPVGTVKSRIHVAVGRMRDAMTDEGDPR